MQGDDEQAPSSGPSRLEQVAMDACLLFQVAVFNQLDKYNISLLMLYLQNQVSSGQVFTRLYEGRSAVSKRIRPTQQRQQQHKVRNYYQLQKQCYNINE